MGVHTAVLLFCVKDNPEIVRITIGCCGVVPIVEILPLTKVIGNVLIYLFKIKMLLQSGSKHFHVVCSYKGQRIDKSIVLLPK